MSDERKNGMSRTYQLTCWGLMAALAFVSNYVMFPLLGSRVTVSNSICVLCGMILGPWAGFVTAGLGAFLYDLIAGYGAEGMITLVSKGAIALMAGLIGAGTLRKVRLEKKDTVRLMLGAAAGAILYVALYMLKTFIYQKFVYGFPMDAVWATMVSKLIPSLINAGAAVVAAPLFYHAVLPALQASGLLSHMRPQT